MAGNDDHLGFRFDPRFTDPDRYLELEDGLPEGFSFVGPPSRQNCFGFCVDMEYALNRFDFLYQLDQSGFEKIHEPPEPGDVVVYVSENTFEGPLHSAVYIGKGIGGHDMVRARWERHSPVMEHPMDIVPNSYMAGQNESSQVKIETYKKMYESAAEPGNILE